MRNFFLTILLFFSLNLTLKANIIRTISVTGTAEKSYQPDIVRVNVSVWGKGVSAKEAQKNNSLRFEHFKKVISDFKIKKDDIKTISYELNPEYVYDQKTNKNNINGYLCNQSLSVTIRGIEQVGTFIDQLVIDQKKDNSGLNVNSLYFDLEQRLEEEKNLLSLSVKAALVQAQSLADAAGVKLKGVYRLAPRGTQMSQPFLHDRGMEASPQMEMKSAGTSLISGEVKVTGEVSVDYLIE